MKHIIFLFIALGSTACIHPQVKVRKANLLDPMMAPGKTSVFSDTMSTDPTQNHERGATGVGAGLGGGCPTCGG